MRDHVRFHSTAFTPPDADPGQANTERYGYALATWVVARLKERGYVVFAVNPNTDTVEGVRAYPDSRSLG